MVRGTNSRDPWGWAGPQWPSRPFTLRDRGTSDVQGRLQGTWGVGSGGEEAGLQPARPCVQAGRLGQGPLMPRGTLSPFCLIRKIPQHHELGRVQKRRDVPVTDGGAGPRVRAETLVSGVLRAAGLSGSWGQVGGRPAPSSTCLTVHLTAGAERVDPGMSPSPCSSWAWGLDRSQPWAEGLSMSRPSRSLTSEVPEPPC